MRRERRWEKLPFYPCIQPTSVQSGCLRPPCLHVLALLLACLIVGLLSPCPCPQLALPTGDLTSLSMLLAHLCCPTCPNPWLARTLLLSTSSGDGPQLIGAHDRIAMPLASPPNPATGLLAPACGWLAPLADSSSHPLRRRRRPLRTNGS